MNDGITRSGSFGPAAELAAAHAEIERLKAWSNEQIAKLAAELKEALALYENTAAAFHLAEARIAELERALELQKRIAEGFSRALMAAEARIAELQEPNHDDPLWLRNEVRRLRGVVKGLYDRILHPNGRCTCGGGGGGDCDWCAWSRLAEAEAEGPDHGEADPDYPPHAEHFTGPVCATCKGSGKVMGDCGDSPNVWLDPCPDCKKR